MLYDSKCVKKSEFKWFSDYYKGWEYYEPTNEDVVYLRQYISGEENKDPKWKIVS